MIDLGGSGFMLVTVGGERERGREGTFDVYIIVVTLSVAVDSWVLEPVPW